MKRKLSEEILRFKQITNINEGEDIRGVDELVFNPVTGPGGKIGFGYDQGKKRKGITWKKHHDHLHVSFDDKQVAIEIMEKALSLGLYVAENPYLGNKDKTGKVDWVHADDSHHYKNFDNIQFKRSGDYGGQKVIGKAADISGNMKKMEELIKWIIDTYSTSSSTADPISTNTSSSTSNTTSSTSSSSTSNSSSSNSSNTEEDKLLEKILNTEYLGKDVKFWLDINSSKFNFLDWLGIILNL
jgi:hypothetical protein